MLVQCEKCGRHVRARDARCPFCAAKRAAMLIASVAVGATLAACYGRPVNRDNLDRQPLDAAGATPSATAAPSAAPNK